MPPPFNMLKKPVSTDFKEQGSRFLSYGFPCDSIESFEEQLSVIKKEHYNATHLCYGWRINPFDITEFSQDDGEPSGTAGLPILNQLRSAELCNSGVVVVRYYGGTKLGKSGLISAYGSSASDCITAASLVKITPGKSIAVKSPYEHKKQVEYLTETNNAFIHDATYTAQVDYVIQVPDESYPALFEALRKLEYLGVACDDGKPVILSL